MAQTEGMEMPTPPTVAPQFVDPMGLVNRILAQDVASEPNKQGGLERILIACRRIESGEVLESTGTAYEAGGNILMFEGLNDMLEAIMNADGPNERRTALAELGGAVLFLLVDDKMQGFNL